MKTQALHIYKNVSFPSALHAMPYAPCFSPMQ